MSIFVASYFFASPDTTISAALVGRWLDYCVGTVFLINAFRDPFKHQSEDN